MTNFCSLDYTTGFNTSVINFGFRNTNDKWRNDLTELQQRQLEAELTPHLRRWDYPLAFAPDADNDAGSAA